MSHHRRTTKRDHSFRTDERSSGSLSSRSSNTSTINSVSRHSQKPTDLSIPSYSSATADHLSLSTNERVPRRAARPLGTCVRRCDRCQKLKHVLLAECGGCYRMVDVDLKDCKCHTDISKNVMDGFGCSTCHCQLTLDGYIICANRACQTSISALFDEDATAQLSGESLDSSRISHVSYPDSEHRNLCVQVNTCLSISPLQRLSPTKNGDDPETSSLSSEVSHLTEMRSSSTSGAYDSTVENAEDLLANKIRRNKTVAVNWNQPMKSAPPSEEEQEDRLEQTPGSSDIPKSPRCLAIMNVRQRRERLSVLLPLPSDKICQTALTCLTDSDRMIRCETLEHVTIRRTADPMRTDRQIQVNTLQDLPEDESSPMRIKSAPRDRIDSSRSVANDERIVAALTDRDGKKTPSDEYWCSKNF